MGEDCHLDDDGGPEVYAVEATDGYCHRQSLHIRVGPVFHGGEEATEPGVWIEYQEVHLGCLPAGPVLLTPEVWRELNIAVEYRLRRRRKAGHFRILKNLSWRLGWHLPGCACTKRWLMRRLG